MTQFLKIFKKIRDLNSETRQNIRAHQGNISKSQDVSLMFNLQLINQETGSGRCRRERRICHRFVWWGCLVCRVVIILSSFTLHHCKSDRKIHWSTNIREVGHCVWLLQTVIVTDANNYTFSIKMIYVKMLCQVGLLKKTLIIHKHME